MSPWQIYWIVQADSIGSSFGVACGVLTAFLVLALIIYSIHYPPGYREADHEKATRQSVKELTGKYVRRLIPLVFLTFLIGTFTPTTKGLAAVHVLPVLAESEAIKEISQETYQLTLEWIEELKP